MTGTERRAGRRRNQGFSLLELMVSLVFLSFITIIAMLGGRTAQRAYARAVEKNDAQLLLSQAEERLRKELAFATDIYYNKTNIAYSDGHLIQYSTQLGQYRYPATLESRSDGTLDSDGYYSSDGIFKVYMLQHSDGEAGREFLIPDKQVAQSERRSRNTMRMLKARYNDIIYDDAQNCFIVKGLRVTRGKGAVLAGSDGDAGDIVIQCVNSGSVHGT